MFTENEIATLIEIPEILDATIKARENFKSNQVEYLEITDHDFLSLVMMTPSVGIALANGSVSLFEELALNKMARKMSRGGYFLKIDPVCHAMKFLIEDYDKWELSFFEVIKVAMNITIDKQSIAVTSSGLIDQPIMSFARDLMAIPYILVRFMSSFFLHDEAEIVDNRPISKVEFEKIIDIGNKLELNDLHVFKSFCKTFEVR
jgi:hypothetical protein